VIQPRILAGLAAALAALASIAPAAALEKVRFGTNWLAQAEHGGFYQALAEGRYAGCGLEVEIVQGGPRVNNRALLAAGKIDFYMGGSLLHAFAAVEQGIPTKVVAALFQKEPQMLMTHPGVGLDTWESLKGINLYLSDSGYHSFYQWMMSEHGFSPDKRKVYTFNPAPFLADKTVGQQGYVTSEPFAIEKAGGFKPNIFLIADYGFDTYSTTIEVREDAISDRGETVACFVDASIEGWVSYLYGDPDPANRLITEANPEMTDEQLAFSIEKMKEFGIVDSGDTETLGIGAMTDERFASFFGKMVKAGIVKEDVDYKASYVLDFVNKGVGLELKKELTAQ